MNWMSMREFLRGGYQQITEPTVISNHGRPAFTVYPHNGWTREMAQTVATLNSTEWTTSRWDALPDATNTLSTTVRSDLPDPE